MFDNIINGPPNSVSPIFLSSIYKFICQAGLNLDALQHETNIKSWVFNVPNSSFLRQRLDFICASITRFLRVSCCCSRFLWLTHWDVSFCWDIPRICSQEYKPLWWYTDVHIEVWYRRLYATWNMNHWFVFYYILIYLHDRSSLSIICIKPLFP